MKLTYRYPVNYRKIYEDHHGPIPYDKDGRRLEIHHIDGDHNNNNISNLTAITIQEHYDIHYAQEDWAACLLIAQRMELSPAEISDLARRNTIRKNQREIAAGTHNFLGGQIQREWGQKAVKDGTHHALGPRLNKMRLDAGTHNLLGPKSNLNRLAKGTHPSQMKRTCEHCEKTVAVAMYARWHGPKCKSRA